MQIEPKTIILTVALFAVCFAAVMIREHINTKKGQTGEDLAKIRQVIKRLLPDYPSYTTAYALYKIRRSTGRSVRTTYYHYAVAFKPGELFVVPIQYSGGEVSWQGSGALLTPENLGKVEHDRTGTALFDLSGKELCRFDVHLSYTRQDKYEPFNIQQQAEGKAFEQFIIEFAKEVNSRHS